MSENEWSPKRSEEELEEMKQAMQDKVVGEVEQGDPVEVHTDRDGRKRKILTYYGWFRGNGRAFSGEMEVCCKHQLPSDDDYKLADLQMSPINPEHVEKIVPLKSGVKRTKTDEAK